MNDAIWSYLVTTHEALRPAFFDPIHTVSMTLTSYVFFIMVFFSAVSLISTLYVIARGPSRIREVFLPDKEAPTVTIHIPTRNDIVAINCAKKCLAFDYPKEKYKIFIGDDSDNVEISKQLREFAAKHKNVTLFTRKINKGYKAGNFNNLLKYTKSEYVVTFDSDFLPEEDFLRRIVTPMVYNKDYAGVQAKWAYLNVRKNIISALTTAIPAIYHNIVLELTRGKKRFTTFCGSAQAIRTSALREVGGWNENHGEDVELSLRLLKKGYRIAYLPQLECLSEVPFTLKDACSQQLRWSYGVSLALTKNKDILLSKHIGFVDKLILFHMTVGYWFIFAIIATLFFGLITGLTIPTIATFSISQLIIDFAIGTLFTFGFVIAGAYAMTKTDPRQIGPYLLSIFTIGPFFLHSTSKGLLKGVTSRSVSWDAMQKIGEKE